MKKLISIACVALIFGSASYATESEIHTAVSGGNTQSDAGAKVKKNADSFASSSINSPDKEKILLAYNKQECRDRCSSQYYDCLSSGDGTDPKNHRAQCEAIMNSCKNSCY